MGGTYSSDTLPVDDDAFLNGGLPEPVDTLETNDTPVSAAPSSNTVSFVSGEAQIVKKDMLSTNDSAPKNTPEISKPVSSIDSTEEPVKEASDEAPVAPKAPEAIQENKPEAVESKEVSLQPSASFEQEMKEEAEKGSNIPTNGNMIGQPYRAEPKEAKPVHHQMSHVAGITPSQSMIPDGMLADNRVGVDGESDSEYKEETMIPSQAMAETFTAQPAKLPSLHGDLPDDDSDDGDEESVIDDDAPIVVGPVISSAGMESLSDQQAENPTSNVEATTMKIEAQIDEDEIPDELKGEENKPGVAPKFEKAAPIEAETESKDENATTAPVEEAKPAEETKPVESPATTETIAESTPATEAASTTTENTATDAEKPAEEAPKTEEPAPMQFVSTTTPVTVPSTNSTPADGKAGKKANPTPIIIAAIMGILLIVGGVIAAIMMLSKGEEPEEPVVAISRGFFLENEDGKYALFNEDGERLTDFLYTSQYGTPINFDYYSDKDERIGTAIVYDKEKNIGVIDSTGKIIVEFGKYDQILDSGDLYYAAKGSDRYIVSRNGTVLNKEGTKILATGYDSFVLLDNNNADVYIVTNHGDEIKKAASIACKEHKDACKEKGIMTYYWGTLAREPEQKKALSIYYEGTTHILDDKEYKEVLSFKSDMISYIGDVFIKEGEYYVNAYSDGARKVRYFKNGKEVSLDRNCSSVEGRVVNNKNVAFCYVSGEGTYWLNGNKTSIKLTQKRIYINETTYVEIPDSSKMVFYENGSLVKTIEGSFEFEFDDSKKYYDDTNEPYIVSNRTSELGIYKIKKNLSNEERKEKGFSYEWALYNAKGEQLGDSYLSIGHFDYVNKELAIANTFDGTSLIINKKGKAVSKAYNGTISEEDGSYYIANTLSKSYILDNKGKEVFSISTKEGFVSDIISYKDTVYYVLKNKNTASVHILNGDMVFSVDKVDYVNYRSYLGNYLAFEKTSGDTEYYTFSGKKFYEIKARDLE